MLTGDEAEERIAQRGHDKLSVVGIVPPVVARLLRPLARALQARGSLAQTEHGGLALDGDARDILKGEAGVHIVLPPAKVKRSGRGRVVVQVDHLLQRRFELFLAADIGHECLLLREQTREQA